VGRGWQVMWFGRDGGNHVLVMELVGRTVESLYVFCQQRFSLKTVLLLADQLIARMEAMHRKGERHSRLSSNALHAPSLSRNALSSLSPTRSSFLQPSPSTWPSPAHTPSPTRSLSPTHTPSPHTKRSSGPKANPITCHTSGILHGDIKPDNMAMGRGPKANEVYLLDFGLARYYRDAMTLIHHPPEHGAGKTGNYRFCSLRAHSGEVAPSRRDDLESLAYVLIMLIKGALQLPPSLA
jgi:serine/threonine protein kinase